MALSDRRLAELSRQYLDLKRQQGDIKKQMSKISDKIIAEMDRRGTRLIENLGMRITLTRTEVTTYDYEGLLFALGQQKVNRLRPQSIDAGALAREVTTGRIDLAVVEPHTIVRVNSPYITPTLVSTS
jgi:hypothetical protein